MYFGREPWFPGHGNRLISWKTWVRILSTVYWLDGHFSHWFVVKIATFVWKRPKINDIEAGNGPLKYLSHDRKWFLSFLTFLMMLKAHQFLVIPIELNGGTKERPQKIRFFFWKETKIILECVCVCFAISDHYITSKSHKSFPNFFLFIAGCWLAVVWCRWSSDNWDVVCFDIRAIGK